MSRYRAYFPQDDAPLPDGDNGFAGVICRGAPDLIPPGHLADGVNLRFDDREAATRAGVIKPGWLNKTSAVDSNRIAPFGTIYGVGVFADPNGMEWVLTAADGAIYRHKEQNQLFSLPLPAGVRVLSDCTFTQAFNKIFCWRGRYLKPLILRNIDTGFEDIVPVWDAATKYDAGDETAFGPFTAITLTSDGSTATATTTAPHGFVTGQDIVIRGATETEYNGRFNITVLNETEFSYSLPSPVASPATGAPECSAMTQFWAAGSGANEPAIGDSPESEPAKWTRVYNVIPNAAFALFINNRLLIPTAYTPGAAAYDTTSAYSKVDFIVAADVGDDTHFNNNNFFRINQGASDEIVDLVKFTDDTVIVFKGRSWGVLMNVSGLLEAIAFDLREQSYGLSARGAAVSFGENVYFMAEKRGIVSLRQSEQSKVLGVDKPLSDDIAPLIARIHWNAKNKIRLAVWDNKLYAAVPLDDARATGGNLLTDATYTNGYRYATVEAGKRYMLDIGRAGVYALNGWASGIQGEEIVVPYINGGEFAAVADVISIYGTPGEPTGSLRRIDSGVNNALLVFDFANGRWCGRDTGLAVKEFFKTTVGGVERLCAATEDGWNNVLEASDCGDQTEDRREPGGLAWSEIESSATTRAYNAGSQRIKRGREVTFSIATWNPCFSISQRSEGVAEETALATDVTKSRTDYYKPFHAAPWDPSNVNDDHAKPWRKDYSVPLPVDGLHLGSGIDPMRAQETLERYRATARGRTVQFVISNTQGRLRLKAVELEQVESDRRAGTHA